MPLPFLFISLGFTAGIVTAWVMASPELSVLTFLFFGGYVFLWLFRGRRFFILFFLMELWLAGWIQGVLNQQVSPIAIQHFANAWQPDQRAEKKFLILTGKVSGPPDLKIKGRRQTLSMVVEAEMLTYPSSPRTKNFFLRKRPLKQTVQGKVQVFLFQPPHIPEYGDQVRLFGELEVLKPPLNPGEFDYKAYLEQREIYALFRGYGKSVKIIEPGSPGIFRWLFGLRKKLGIKIEELFEDKNSEAVFKALMTGYQKDVSDTMRDDFMKTGTTHLLAVSGLNITLVVGSFYMLFLLFRIPQKAAALLSLGLVGFYTVTAGLGMPVQRAAWMSTCVFLALILERERSAFNIFFFSFFMLIAFDSRALFQIGFQLSFISVFSLMIFSIRLNGKWGWAEGFQSTIAAMLGTLPVVLYYFHILSPVGILANFMAIPFFHLGLLGAFLAVLFSWCPGAVFLLAGIAQKVITLALAWIHQMARIPWGYIYFRAPTWMEMTLYYLGLLGAVYVWKFCPPILQRFRGRLSAGLMGIWFLSVVLMFGIKARPEFQLVVFSAGQNEMACFSVQGKHYLINTGRAFPSSQARWIVEPYLRGRGVHEIEAVILTDLSAKHIGGMTSIGSNFRIKATWIPEWPKQKKSFAALRIKKSWEGKVLKSGQIFDLGSAVHFEVMDIQEGKMGFRLTRGNSQWVFANFLTPGIQELIEKSSYQHSWFIYANEFPRARLENGALDQVITNKPDAFLKDYALKKEILFDLRQGAFQYQG